MCPRYSESTKGVSLTWVGKGGGLAQVSSKTETWAKAYLLTLGSATQRTRTEVKWKVGGETKDEGCTAHAATAS